MNGYGCSIAEPARRWAEADGHTELSGWRSGAVVEVPWLGVGTYVIEELLPA